MQTFSITDFSGDTQYGQAVARVRVLETLLLPKRTFARMAEAPHWEAMLEELRGSMYIEPLAHVLRADQLEAALAQIEERHCRMIRTLSPEPHLINALTAWSSFNTLKVVLQAHLTRTSRRVPWEHRGTLDPEQVRDLLEARRPLPKPFEHARVAAEADYEQHHSLFRSDAVVDRSFQEHLRAAFEDCGIPFLKYFARYWIDLANVGMVLRWRLWQEHTVGRRPQPFDTTLLATGGFVSKDTLKALTEEPWERLAAILHYTPYARVFREAIEAYQHQGVLWPLEKLSDDFLSAFCRLTQYTPFGVEPLVAFIWFSLQEVKNLMTVTTAKYAALPAAVVIPRLRGGYHA